MLLAGVLCGCLLQVDPVRRVEVASAVSAAVRSEDFNRKSGSELERRQFEQKFNGLIDALRDFTQAYNSSNGTVWPLKKVEAINKAFRELERTRSWVPKTGSADKADLR